MRTPLQAWRSNPQCEPDVTGWAAADPADLDRVFLVSLQLLASQLLQPFRSPIGQVVLGLAVLWMVLGYRVMQQMTQAPREERLRLRGTQP